MEQKSSNPKFQRKHRDISLWHEHIASGLFSSAKSSLGEKLADVRKKAIVRLAQKIEKELNILEKRLKNMIPSSTQEISLVQFKKTLRKDKKFWNRYAWVLKEELDGSLLEKLIHNYNSQSLRAFIMKLKKKHADRSPNIWGTRTNRRSILEKRNNEMRYLHKQWVRKGIKAIDTYDIIKPKIEKKYKPLLPGKRPACPGSDRFYKIIWSRIME